MLGSNEALPRHAGRLSPGKVADAITARGGSKFNRQHFKTKPWCGRMLAALEGWMPAAAPTALAEAMRAADAKVPADKRVGDLERENLLLRAGWSSCGRSWPCSAASSHGRGGCHDEFEIDCRDHGDLVPRRRDGGR